MRFLIACVLLGPSLAACSIVSVPRSMVALPIDARSDPSNFIVVTVRNTGPAAPGRAASTPRGYEFGDNYRAGGQSIRTARAIASDYGLTEAASWPIAMLEVNCLVYRIPSAGDRPSLLRSLQKDPRVDSAQPLAVFAVRSSGYNDPYARLQGNLDAMQVPAAQRWSRGAGVRVAVVDTGVDTQHPDFAGRIAAAADFVADGTGGAAESHGTEVAGVIAAIPNNRVGIAGIAPDANVIALRACWTVAGNTAGICNSFTLAQGVVAAIDAGAKIVNLSLGGPSDPLLERIVDRGMRAGVIFVGAVPASGRRQGFPTGIDGVLAAGVMGQPEGVPGVLYAPGNDVFTLTPGGHYDAASGSSISAAEVTGIAALLLSKRPGLDAQDIEALLNQSMRADATSTPSSTGVNACLALRQLLGAGDCPPATDAAVGTRPPRTNTE